MKPLSKPHDRDAAAISKSLMLVVMTLLTNACSHSPVISPPASSPIAPPQARPDPDTAKANTAELEQKAIAMMQDSHYDSAIESLLTLIKQQPQRANLYANLGIAYARIHRFKEANTAFSEAQDRQLDNAEFYNQWGIVYRQTGQFDAAKKAYQKALRLDPKSANAELNLGILLEIYLQQPAQALPHYQSYLVLRKDKQVSKWVMDLKRRYIGPQP